MQLSFSTPHISIKAFPTIEIPQLTVIVGINGSGKSHLLQAIQNGRIRNSIAPPTDRHTGLPNTILMAPDAPKTNVLPQASYQSPTSHEPDFSDDQSAREFEAIRKQILQEPLAAILNLYGGMAEEIRSEDFWRQGMESLIQRFPFDQNNKPIDKNRIEDLFRDAEKRFEIIPPEFHRVTIRDDIKAESALVRQVWPISQKLNISPLLVCFSHLKEFGNWGDFDVFDADIARWFGKYRDRKLKYNLKQFSDFKKRIETNPGDQYFPDDQDFVDKFGSPPWDRMNETLRDFGLPFEFLCPDLEYYAPIVPILKKIDTEEKVRIESLSSGQKVIFKFAVSTFQFDEAVMNVRRPKLVLLDEMDASLHPEMVRRWLTAISSGLVERQGIACILTTHSPTTVALAPEESLFEMVDGEQGLRKVGKQEALNRLTVGVPTLSIDFSGRRQVFVESDTDVPIFEKLFALLKGKSEFPRHLHFMSSGLRKQDGGEMNSGCSIVRRLVEGLKDQGNQSTFGIVDWDGNAESTPRVKVLAEGRKDGIENVILDPLLVALLLIKRRIFPVGVDEGVTFVGANSMSDGELQKLADAIQGPLRSELSDDLTTIETEFLNGHRILVLDSFNKLNDHDLERILVQAFPKLKTWSGKGKLALAIVDEVISEFPGFCPVEINSLFLDISTANS